MQFMKIWLGGSGAVIVAMIVWAFAPVLIPVLGMTAGLAAVVFAIVAGARWLERARSASRR